MKKLLSLLLICTSFLAFFTGCTKENSTMEIGKNVDRNLNKLSTIVTKLDTIDTNYIANPDFMSNKVKNKIQASYALAFNAQDETDTNEIIKQLLIKKLQDQLLNKNGNCTYCQEKYITNENGFCSNCGNGVICDENGNCYNCQNPLTLNDNYECSNCNKYALVNEFKSSENDDYIIEKLSTSNNIITSEIEHENLPATTNEQTDIEDVDTVLDERQDNQSNTKFYFYTRESFEPIKLKYKPRYVNEYNESTINDQMVNYLYKIQKLYAMTEDAIEANNILGNCKFNLLDSVKDVRSLNECIINGTCEPTIQQLQALQNYIYDIKTTIKNLKNCNGALTDEVNNISGNTPTSVATSVDVINSNYMRLINHLDTRISYHESAIATLEQMKYLLNEAVGNNNITEDEIQNVIDSLTPPQIEEEIENNDTPINDTNSENVIDSPITDTPEVGIDNSEAIVESNENDMNNTPVINKDILLDENTEYNDSNAILEDNLEPAEDNENVIIDETVDEEDTQTSIKNIDTYMDDTFPKNNEENLEDNNVDILNNDMGSDASLNNSDLNNIDTQYDSAITNGNNTNNNVLNNNTLNNDNILGTNNELNGSYDNNGLNNGTMINGGYSTYENSIGFNNSIITQNNLNNNDGYGGYYYGNDGQIHNNGLDNGGEIGNNGNTIENNLNGNNNVNTYGYNTMLDVINQGTVNNGINTL